MNSNDMTWWSKWLFRVSLTTLFAGLIFDFNASASISFVAVSAVFNVAALFMEKLEIIERLLRDKSK